LVSEGWEGVVRERGGGWGSDSGGDAEEGRKCVGEDAGRVRGVGFLQRGWRG